MCYTNSTSANHKCPAAWFSNFDMPPRPLPCLLPTAIYGLVFRTESGELQEICRDEGTAAEPAAP